MAKKKVKLPPTVEADVVEVPEVKISEPVVSDNPRRPNFDLELIRTMLKAGASGEELADTYGCDRRTVYAFILEKTGMKFGDFQRQMKASTRHLLRMTQLKVAVGYADTKVEIKRVKVPGKDGKPAEWIEVERKETTLHHPPNAAVLIFMGKNTLDQSDNPEQKGDAQGKFGSVPDYRMIGDEEEGETPQLGPGADEEEDDDSKTDRFDDDDSGDDDDE